MFISKGAVYVRKMVVLAILFLFCSLPCYGQEFYVRTVEADMLDLINEIREESFLPTLAPNWEATRVAQYKAMEMKKFNYTGHMSPVYGNPAEMLNKYGIPFQTVGENLSAGATDTRETVDGWLNTAAYRKNIFDPAVKEAGIGYCRDGDDSYWVVLLIS